MQTKSKELGIIGLGDMGSNIAKVLLRNEYSLTLYNRTEEKSRQFAGMANVHLADSLNDLVKRLSAGGNSITVWLMVTPGEVTNKVISDISTIIPPKSIVIDGSNSVYEDTVSNYAKLKARDAFYLDVGCAGGPGDVLKGTTLMVGGDKVAFDMAENIFKALVGENGAYGYVGGCGSGQRAKCVHNVAFYAFFPILSELTDLMLKMREKDPKSNFDVSEVLRLLSESHPINGGIIDALSNVVEAGNLPKEAPQMKVSTMVSQGVRSAKDFGAQLNATTAVLSQYNGELDEDTRRIYAAAKRILTGH